MAPTGASTIVPATKWRQDVAVDVSPQNRFALRIKATKWRHERSLSPLRGFRSLSNHFSVDLRPQPYAVATIVAGMQRGDAMSTH